MATSFQSAIGLRGLGVRCWMLAIGLGLSLLLIPTTHATEPTAVISSPDVMWSMSTAERARAYPIRFEGRVNFADPAWRNLWFENDGLGFWVALSPTPPTVRSGQRVRIEGTWVPSNGLEADRTRVTILQESEPVVPIAVGGRINEAQRFDRRVVVTDAYVDEQQAIDSEHVRLWLIVDDRPVIGWVRPDDPRAIPQWQGKMVRITAVYSSRFDPTGNESRVELWAARQSDVEVLGTIAAAADFSLPVTPIGDIRSRGGGAVVRIRGRVQQRERGVSIVLRDKTGEVEVRSLQRARIPVGATVEAVGRASTMGARWVLESAFYRQADPPVVPEAAPPADSPLETAEEVRHLSPAEAAKGRPAILSGLVTWSLPEADFFFLQDISGGVRVRYRRNEMGPPPLQKYIRVEGVTVSNGTGPAVELRQIHDLGAMEHPRPREVTFAQALRGGEDAQWVEMRGFVRRTESDGDWRWVFVTSPEGEFVAHLLSAVNFEATPGSLLRVRGVCEAITERSGRVSGVMLRVPFLHNFVVEEDAPADPFGLPLRTLESLRRLSMVEEMIRVRISGTVSLHVPGQSLAVQDAGTGVMALSRSTDPLAPGDVVEAVGILGREGARTLLREAVYRRVRRGAPPPPVVLTDPRAVSPELDTRLARVTGVLVDRVRSPQRTRLTVQAGGAFFDALLEGVGWNAPGLLPPVGATLELTGVLKIEYDDARQARGFQLLLRSPADVATLVPPRLWTVQRALGIAGALAGVILLVFVWVAALRHRVRKQTAQIKEQLERQVSLEAELERAQRFRSLGVLAGGIAHDFNNLLTGIMGNTTLAMLDEVVMARVGESLRDVENSAKRARDLTHHLVTFAKGGDPLRAAVDLTEVINAAAGLALSGSKSRADFRYADGLFAVHADRDQLGRVIQNLVVHSAGSMPEGGTITIEAANEQIAAGDRPGLEPGRYVRVTIEDNGPGVPEDLLPGFFDPYNATRFGDDRFNMAIAYSTARRHGGQLTVESRPGRGTVFKCWVPASEGPLPRRGESPASEKPLPEGLAGTRILLMDDEEAIRRVGEKMLQRLNCELRLTTHGEECVRAYREALEAGRRFDLVILDLTVAGGMGGRQTIVELRKLDPAVRAIVSSGYAADPVLANFRDHGFCGFVAKPYDMPVLAHAIKDALDLAA